MPLKKKKYNARFPAGRIKKIMQTDEEVGKVAQAVPVIISRTLEMFVESLLTKSLQVTLSRNAKTLSPSHLKQCILAESRFDFLRDLVKTIPDISAAEEKEAWSTENSPNTCRFNEAKRPRLASQASVASHNNNTHSSDSNSDSELISKIRLELHGSRSNYATSDENRVSRVSVPSSHPVPLVGPTLQIIPLLVNQPPIAGSHRLLNRPTNFYQETLRDEEEKRESPPVYSSVIQPNPEYSGVTPVKQLTPDRKITPVEQPKFHLDLSKGFSKNVDVVAGSTSIMPVFHIDLSNIPINQSCTDALGSPFTPTLLRQPQTPLPIEPNPLFHISDATRSNVVLQRSDSFNQYRKGPPPLTTLKRAFSFDNSRSSVKTPNLQSPDVDPNQIRKDKASHGKSPRCHVDIFNYKFGSASSPPPLTQKRRKITPTEPPALLPITPAPKPTSMNLPRLSSTAVQLDLDEDYDT